jgi:hypothetical protein
MAPRPCSGVASEFFLEPRGLFGRRRRARRSGARNPRLVRRGRRHLRCSGRGLRRNVPLYVPVGEDGIRRQKQLVIDYVLRPARDGGADDAVSPSAHNPVAKTHGLFPMRRRKRPRWPRSAIRGPNRSPPSATCYSSVRPYVSLVMLLKLCGLRSRRRPSRPRRARTARRSPKQVAVASSLALPGGYSPYHSDLLVGPPQPRIFAVSPYR